MFFANVYITRVYKLLLFSFCYFSLSSFFYFSFLFHERIFPGGLQLFVFPHLPPFPVHILLGCFSLSIPFFIVLDATFALIYTAPSDFLFFFSRPSMRWNFRFPLISFFFRFSFISPFRSTLISLFVHSTSFALSLSLLYLFPCVVPALVQRPGLRCFSRFSTHVNARSLIFLSSLSLVRPTNARECSCDPSAVTTFSVFLFGMYVRYPIRDLSYLVSILSFSVAQSAFFERHSFLRCSASSLPF